MKMAVSTTVARKATRHSITVQAKTTAKEQSPAKIGSFLLSRLMARVVAVLEATPPRIPVKAIPSFCPNIRTATYPPKDAPETNTTIIQMAWGFRQP